MFSTLRISLCICFLSCYTQVFAHELDGRIIGPDQNPLSAVAILIKGTSNYAVTDTQGYFKLPGVWPGDTLEISCIGYKKRSIVITDKILQEQLLIHLSESPLNLDQVVLSPGVNSLEMMALIDFREIQVQSAQELLELVPGLFTGQHAGGGKAEQIFLRGFDIDHGTDIAISVDGMPVNQVSHAHGQGYADTHFIIPETLAAINYGKGPYDPRNGNFTTAGFVNMKTLDVLSENMIRTEGGMFGSFRLLNMTKLLSDVNHNAYIASSYRQSDGYFNSPQDFQRLNIFGKYHYEASDGSSANIALSHFSSSWSASGQIPVRSVRDGTIDRFGAIDDTEGGTTSRTGLRLNFREKLDAEKSLLGHAYISRYTFDLVSNFTFFLNDPEFGDQIRQTEERWTGGGEVQFQNKILLRSPREQAKYTLGTGIRSDWVDNVSLARTVNKTVVKEQLAFGDVRERNWYAFGEFTYHRGKWTLKPGLRAEMINFNYSDKLSSVPAEDDRREFMVNPKLSVRYSPSTATSYELKLGRGYHSNDSRVATARPASPVLPAALGADLRGQWKIQNNLLLSTTLWGLLLEQEFIYVGDEGIVEPGGRSRRYGIEVGARYQPIPSVYLYSDLTLAHARILNEGEDTELIPLAPDLTLAAGLRYNPSRKFSAGLQMRYLGDRPATSDGRITTEDYFITDLNLEYTIGKLSMGVLVENLLDTEWKETQFATTSRLQNEVEGVEEIHFTPGTPFALRGRISVRF